MTVQMLSPNVFKKLAQRYAGQDISQFADQQPKVLNNLTLSRLAALNEAERKLRQLGVVVLKRESSLRLNGKPQRLTIKAPTTDLLDLYSDSGKQLCWGAVDGVRVLKLHVFGVDVVWSQPA